MNEIQKNANTQATYNAPSINITPFLNIDVLTASDENQGEWDNV